MLKNYLVVALRSLRKHRLYAFINVAGLAVGLACCLLIARYVQHERAYDRHHAHADRIYRLTSETGVAGTRSHFAAAAPPMAAVFQAEFPEVERAVRILAEEAATVQVGQNRFEERRLYYADPTLFDVFTVPLLAGDPRTALSAPNQVVLTRSTARRYFGNASPLGRSILVDGDVPYQVTGVAEDVPITAHFHYDLIASMASLGLDESTAPDAWVSDIGYATYLLLRPGTDVDVLTRKAAALVEATIGEMMRNFDATYVLHLQPLLDLHLHSQKEGELEPTGDAMYVTVLSLVAAFILLLAGINFVNLTTARSADRAREGGMRKALGAHRRQLVGQFLAETMLLAGLAVALAVVLAAVALPAFSALAGRTLTLWDGTLVLALVGALVLVGLVGGAYPAFYLSAFQPARTLRGGAGPGERGVALRRGLVVLQFTVSVALIVGTLVVEQQLRFARSERLGFAQEHVLVLPAEADPRIAARQDAFKAAVLTSPAVVSASLSEVYPGSTTGNAVLVPAGRPDVESVHFWIYQADFDLLNTLGMELVSGRGFDPALPTDSGAVLINETAARQLGWTEPDDHALVGLAEPGPAGRVTMPVIGIVRDFHFESFRQPIRPVVFRAHALYDHLLVRVQAGRLDQALADLEATWATFAPGTPFAYRFLDTEFGALYRADQQFGRAFRYFAGLAVFIACLGLFGLAAYTAERRTKEIGVRKVLGASAAGIVALLSRDFARLVLVAVLIAAPTAYFAMDRWLAGFAYRVELAPDVFIAAGAIALGVALLTVSAHALRAAYADPVKALRCE